MSRNVVISLLAPSKRPRYTHTSNLIADLNNCASFVDDESGFNLRWVRAFSTSMPIASFGTSRKYPVGLRPILIP